MGATLGLRFLNRQVNGPFTLAFYKLQGDGQPLKLLQVLAEDSVGVFFGRVKDQGTGAMVDALVVDEGTVTEETLRQCEMFDKVDEHGALRYRPKTKTPPRGRVRRWVFQVEAKFNDTTPVDL